MPEPPPTGSLARRESSVLGVSELECEGGSRPEIMEEVGEARLRRREDCGYREV